MTRAVPSQAVGSRHQGSLSMNELGRDVQLGAWFAVAGDQGEPQASPAGSDRRIAGEDLVERIAQCASAAPPRLVLRPASKVGNARDKQRKEGRRWIGGWVDSGVGGHGRTITRGTPGMWSTVTSSCTRHSGARWHRRGLAFGPVHAPVAGAKVSTASSRRAYSHSRPLPSGSSPCCRDVVPDLNPPHSPVRS